MSPAIVTLLTDFGTTDTYVGQMKGIMLSIDRTLRLIDLTHEIPPQDVLEGAFQLATALGPFPQDTVHLGVVDPGVGTSRRAVAVQTGAGTFVGPDNGLFTFAFEHGVVTARELKQACFHRNSVTATFHGRDIFAPMAARIASGVLPLDEVGPEVDPETLVRLDVPSVFCEPGLIRGTILSIDRFGNCLTLIRADHLPEDSEVSSIECGDFRVERLSRTYADLPNGSPVALVGSFGTLELSETGGNAASRWSLERGDLVTVRTQPRHATG